MIRTKTILIVGLLAALLAPQWTMATSVDTVLTRGEAVDMAVKYFNLEGKNQKFFSDCQIHADSCYFEFFSRTNFNDYKLKPLILYPDVFPSNSYYKSINEATALGLVRGYWQEENSPFYPDKDITKAEALKLVMGASGQLDWKDQFELTLASNIDTETISSDDDKLITKLAGVSDIKKLAWWYPRYLIKGLKAGLLKEGQVFKPEQTITKGEFQDLLDSTNSLLVNESSASNNQEEKFAANSAGQTQPGES